MFMNRNKLSALALGTLLSVAALQPARAADVTEQADAKWFEWVDQQLRLTDGGSPASASQDRPAPAYQGASMTVPPATDKTDQGDWYEQQLRVEHG